MAVPGHVYHWKHGWIPLTHFAALQKAHGSSAGAARYLAASHGIHGSHSPGEYHGGVHEGGRARLTMGTLRNKGLGVGSTIYWRHPQTGTQTRATIVGVEHTGHIIVRHSGNRNALIGHSTWQATPWLSVPQHNPASTIAPTFRNPHPHTRPAEFVKPGLINLPEPPKSAIKPFTPATSNSALPETWERLHNPDPSTIFDTDTNTRVGRMMQRRYKPEGRIREAYKMGPHRVIIQSPMNREQVTGLLNDVKEVLHTTHPTLNGDAVNIIVPTGDRRLGKSGNTLGYVFRGGHTIQLAPHVAKGEYLGNVTNANLARQSPPAATKTGIRKYVITHELGHVVDNHKGHRATYTNEDFPQNANLGTYANGSKSELYAEAFAQHVIDPGSNVVASEYARKFGWQLTHQKGAAA